jgi:hypothetical protein
MQVQVFNSDFMAGIWPALAETIQCPDLTAQSRQRANIIHNWYFNATRNEDGGQGAWLGLVSARITEAGNVATAGYSAVKWSRKLRLVFLYLLNFVL